MEADVSLEKPCSELNDSSMRVGSPYFTQPAPASSHAITRFLPLTLRTSLGLNYASDGNGVASFSAPMLDFSLSGTHPVAGRVVVVHAREETGYISNKIGCGVIEPTAGEVVHLQRYPGYTYDQDALNVSGTMVLEQTDDSVTIKGVVGGLEEDTTGGLHIHSGYTCDDADGVGGHYYEGMSDDPWDTTYTSDADGAAAVDVVRGDFSLSMSYPVFGRTMVVHASDSSKVGCGIIGSPKVAVAQIEMTHSQWSTYRPNGTIAVVETEEGIMLKGTLVGLPPDEEAGFHIHSGVSCDDFGNHYWPWPGNLDDDLGSYDPWAGEWSA